MSVFSQLELQEIQDVKQTLFCYSSQLHKNIGLVFSNSEPHTTLHLTPLYLISFPQSPFFSLIFHICSIYFLFYLILLSIQTLHSSCWEPRPPCLHTLIPLVAQLPERMCAGLQQRRVREGKIPFCCFIGSFNCSLLCHTHS